MSRQNKAGAISALLIGLLVFAVSISTMGARASTIARLQSGTATTTPTLTPCDDDPGVCSDDATDAAIDAQTATADAQTATAAATPSPGTATNTTAPGTGTPTITPTPTATTLSTAATLAPSPFIPTPTIDSQRLVPTETPTAIPDSVLTCFPGQPLVISGAGPAHAPFLVYFDQRIVTGGSVSPTGRFAATLIIGHERAGVYSITVRVRGTTQVLLATSCAVPNVTPTLIPRGRDLP